MQLSAKLELPPTAGISKIRARHIPTRGGSVFTIKAHSAANVSRALGLGAFPGRAGSINQYFAARLMSGQKPPRDESPYRREEISGRTMWLYPKHVSGKPALLSLRKLLLGGMALALAFSFYWLHCPWTKIRRFCSGYWLEAKRRKEDAVKGCGKVKKGMTEKWKKSDWNVWKQERQEEKKQEKADRNAKRAQKESTREMQSGYIPGKKQEGAGSKKS